MFKQHRTAATAVALLLSFSACAGANSGSSLVPAASDAKTLHPHTSPYTYVASSLGPSAVAQCPTGEIALSGGFDDPSGAQVLQSHYVGGHTAWKAVAANGASLTTYVVCADSNFIDTQYKSLAWSNSEGAAPECGSGYSMNGGGYTFTSGHPATSYPGANWLWVVQSNADFSSSGTAYAICAHTSSYTYVTGGAGTTSVANCPTGDVVVGGGFQVAGSYNANTVVTHSSYYDGHKAWKVTASGTTFNAYAICAANG